MQRNYEIALQLAIKLDLITRITSEKAVSGAVAGLSAICVEIKERDKFFPGHNKTEDYGEMLQITQLADSFWGLLFHESGP